MTIELQEARPPAFLKMAFYGDAGSGKTWTAAKVLAQFIRDYAPEKRLAFFDTENGAGFVGEMVKEITNQNLLVVAATTVIEVKEFMELCANENMVGLMDSATHPWRTLCEDYMEAKRSRVQAAGGNPETARMELWDWQAPLEVWEKSFADPFKFLPAHLCYCGRAGDVWEMTKDDEGKSHLERQGTKMKVQKESAYEPSLLLEMKRVPNPAYDPLREARDQWLHRAIVVKDRSGRLTASYADNPDIEFFRPHIEFLVGGSHRAPEEVPPVFGKTVGKNWETIRRERQAVLDTIKDELVLVWPGQSAEEKKAKVAIVRQAFGQNANWTDLEQNEKVYPIEILQEGLQKIRTIIKEVQDAKSQ